MSVTENNKICITAVVTEPMGASCRKLIYNAGLVADRLGINLEIVRDIDLGGELDKQLSPPFLILGDLVLGRDMKPDRLEQLVRERKGSI
ncbi:MAG: hypothetical protein ACOY31_04840 [Bacillota bacterium]